MNISLVKYSQEFMHHGLKCWIGGEVTLEAGDNAMEGIKALKSLVHASFYGEKAQPIQPPPPQPYLTDEQLPEQQVEKSDRQETLNIILKDLEVIDNPTTLQNFGKLYLKTYPEIKPSYQVKYEQLKAVEISEQMKRNF